MPIGKSVGAAISEKHLKDVVSGTGCSAIVEINPPEPNAQVKFGYDCY